MPNVFIYFLYILKTSSYASMFVSLNASVRQVIYRDKYFLLFLFLLISVTSRNVKRQLQLISVMNNQQSWKRWKKNVKRRKNRQRNLPRDSPAKTQNYHPIFSHNYQTNGIQVRPLLLRGFSQVISRYLSVLNVSCLWLIGRAKNVILPNVIICTIANMF